MDGRHSPRLGLIAATQQADDEVNVHVKKKQNKKNKKTKQTCSIPRCVPLRQLLFDCTESPLRADRPSVFRRKKTKNRNIILIIIMIHMQ